MTVSRRALPDGLPRPRFTSLDEPFWSGLREHRILIQRCAECATWRFGPEVLCWRCHSFEARWEEVEPRARVFSWERSWHAVHQALDDAMPYVVVLVELPHAGGVRMIGNLLGTPDDIVEIGAEVRAVFEDHDDYTLLQWERCEI